MGTMQPEGVASGVARCSVLYFSKLALYMYTSRCILNCNGATHSSGYGYESNRTDSNCIPQEHLGHSHEPCGR